MIEVSESAPTETSSTDIEDWLRAKLSGDAPALGVPDKNTLYAIYYPAACRRRCCQDIEADRDAPNVVRRSRSGCRRPGLSSAARTDAGEPIFDLPRRSIREPLHEPRFSGYPHLLVATEDGAAAIREGEKELESRHGVQGGPGPS